MAKQRRPQPRSVKAPVQGSGSSAVRPADTLESSSSKPAAAQPVPPAPQRRTTYFEAVAVYEKGLEALQRHDYQSALDLLQSVLRLYPEEKELHERVRLYLNICERHASPRAAAPQSVDERLYASTLAINGARYDEAISHLRPVRDEDPDNDHAVYMLAGA